MTTVEVRRHSAYCQATKRLSRKGRALARSVGRSARPWDLVVCSPVVRARQTAWLVSGGRGAAIEALAPADELILPVIPEPWLWGSFQENPPEVVREIGLRALRGVEELIDTAGAETVLVITHSGIVQSMGSAIRRSAEPGADELLGFLEGFRMVSDGGWTLTDVLVVPSPSERPTDG